ncbi:TPA: DUF3800 domain-containing protein [Pasteurella multocida]
MNIFIDESGNTGDLIKENIDLDFAGQKIFVLSAIKPNQNSIPIIEKHVQELRKKHKIKSDELKSTKLFKNNPKFIFDLVIKLLIEKVELLIEVVDKKFYLCCSIVNHQIFPPYFTENESDGFSQLKRNIISDYLTKNLTINEFQSFANSCLELSEDNLEASWKALLNFSNSKNDFFSQILVNHINKTKDDYRIMKERIGKDNAIKNFIPIPDLGKNNKKIYLLPQISCLTNIVARVNYSNNLDEIRFLHDEQKHFDDIMIHNVNLMKSLGDIGISFNYANFNIDQEPYISFENLSSDNLCIQVADIISGFMMRYVQKVVNDEKIEEIYHIIFHLINTLSHISPQNGTGINFVMDRKKLSKLNINVISPMQIKYQDISDIYYNMDLARQED